MRSFREFGRWLALGSLWVLGCSGDVIGSALENACSTHAEAYRSREKTCYGVAPAPDQSTVIARQTKDCVAISSAPGSTVDAHYWNACAAATENHCQAYQCATYPNGTRQTGDPCLVSTQCATLWCKGTVVTDSEGAALPQGLQCGKCAARLGEGLTCDPVTDACQVGMSCFEGSCRTRGGPGDACVHWSDCAPPLICRGTGICGDVVAAGEPCTSSLDCTTDQGCDVALRVCAAIRKGQPGEDCDGEVRRCESGRCNTTTGRCPRVIADGTSCDPSDPLSTCAVYAYCFQGICQISDPSVCQ